MAISYPLMMPTTGVVSTTFELMYNDAVNDLSGGTIATEIIPPYWDITITTVPMQRLSERYRLWRAFVNNLRGSKKVGLFYDADHPRPTDYVKSGLPATKAGGGAFDGTGDIDAISTRRMVTISGLPANFQFRATDYIGFENDDRRFLAMLSEDSLANGSGIATVSFEPALPLLFNTDSTFNIEKPVTEGILQQNGVDGSRELEGSPLTVHARSRIF